ncbi:hypothetical protein M5361_13820 [Ligilactobacillus agilis]|nr:hypothetical protein [Ligilactobacillus agilis]
MNYKLHVKNSVSNFVASEITSRGWTNNDLAEILRKKGITVNAGVIQSWRSGSSVPKAYVILALADLCETSTDEILGAFDL